jgi:hypothetical protein
MKIETNLMMKSINWSTFLLFISNKFYRSIPLCLSGVFRVHAIALELIKFLCCDYGTDDTSFLKNGTWSDKSFAPSNINRHIKHPKKKRKKYAKNFKHRSSKYLQKDFPLIFYQPKREMKRKKEVSIWLEHT